MIDRTWLPRAAPMTYWPDWDSAPLRALCAPLSGRLDSPRGIPALGNGYVVAPKVLAAKVSRIRAAHSRRKARRGKAE